MRTPEFISGNGVAVYKSTLSTLLVLDDWAASKIEDASQPAHQVPIGTVDFLCSGDGETVTVEGGKIITARLEYAGGPITVTAKSITGFAPSTSGFIYVEVPVEYYAKTASISPLNAPIAIGGNDYYYQMTNADKVLDLGSTYDDATSVAAGSDFAAEEGIYRKRLCSYSVSADGVVSVQQISFGSVFLPQAMKPASSVVVFSVV